ncbi:endo-a-1-4-glucanase [Penicillium malachiteum]|uniref:endo-a-1-4-glucanase n=1 Tax=Penicillium malachiteum TaxID=1324776 RepID=UPI0025472EA9|nr:endo-a-1-4-glucanase [Penicillium malachiteum]KAJ5735383.1 endo-a-1-4-glucanase [Penicillium malachiteum]
MRFNRFAILAAAASAVASPLNLKKFTKKASSFKWFGSNESGAEFGTGIFPGVYGTDYIFPDTSTIQTLIDDGMNIFRVTFLMERLVPTEMTGSFDAEYLSNLTYVVNYITDAGVHAIIDPHNFVNTPRLTLIDVNSYGSIIESTSDFQTFWTNVAGQFASNDLVIFDTNNEYYGMDQTLVLDLNQAAIDGIRAAGATTQYIFVEGNSYTGAWTWTEYNDNLVNLTDTEDKIVYEMHQYLDSDGSGTSATCVSSTIGQSRVESATQWLIDNNKVGILGEFAGGVNDVCEEAIEGMLSYMEENSAVWLGGLWWAAGPWWGDYIFSMEPPEWYGLCGNAVDSGALFCVSNST